MNHAPLIFLGVFATLVASWWTMIFSPNLQVGAQQSKPLEGGAIYPATAPGIAEQGRRVYVSAGCVYCHSQQVHQESYTFDVVLLGTTNQQATASAVGQLSSSVDAANLVNSATEQNPQPILRNVTKKQADAAQTALTESGASAQIVFIPVGADMKRGWGARLAVGQDYLYQYPVQIGNSRLGSDLSNVGLRQPDAGWHLRHLYNPRSEVKGSIMPAYQYLFEKRKAGRQPSPDALKLAGEFAPEAGYEIVPKPEALQLAAYLQSLRVDAPLFEAPMTIVAPPPAAADTNAPAATNAAPTNAP